MPSAWQLLLHAQQLVSVGHLLPHLPQLASSLGTQAPLQHSCPVAQARPHSPQFLGSAVRSMQPVAQQVSGELQPPEPLQRHSVPTHVLPCVHGGAQLVCVHTPCTHANPAEHTVEQLPQWLGSDSLSKQPVAQHSSVPTQARPPWHEH
jgi:hypothetical protein